MDALPIRTRDNSNSFMVFFRAAGNTYKRSLKFMIEGEASGIELMAEGQQVVVAAYHRPATRSSRHWRELPFATCRYWTVRQSMMLWLQSPNW